MSAGRSRRAVERVAESTAWLAGFERDTEIARLRERATDADDLLTTFAGFFDTSTAGRRALSDVQAVLRGEATADAVRARW